MSRRRAVRVVPDDAIYQRFVLRPVRAVLPCDTLCRRISWMKCWIAPSDFRRWPTVRNCGQGLVVVRDRDALQLKAGLGLHHEDDVVLADREDVVGVPQWQRRYTPPLT